MFGVKFPSASLRKPRRRPQRPVRYVPVLHALEVRCLLSTFHEYPVPDNGLGVNLSGITAGPDGNVWFTHAGTFPHDGELESITPAGAITTFPQPPGTSARAIVTGADGNLWYGGIFRESFEQAVIGQMTTDGTVTKFFGPNFGGFVERVQVVTLGPDGNVWYGQSMYTPQEGVIGHITPDGQLTEYAIPTANGNPQLITAGPDGNIWFTELGSGQIGEFVLGDGGGAGGAARSAPPAQGPRAVSVAAVEALFAGTGRPVVDSVVNSQLTTVARQPGDRASCVDAIFAASRSDLATVPTAPQAQVKAPSLSHLHQADAAVAHDIAGLTDPLTDTL
jgi:hypothetical protein